MDWTQIETKWGEMARRVSADARYGNSIDSAGSEFLAAESDADQKVVTRQIATVGAETKARREAVSTR